MNIVVKVRNNILVVLCCSLFFVSANTHAQELTPFSYKEDFSFLTLWGYADAEGNVVIEPQYFEAGYFVEGLALVATSSFDFGNNLTYGYINPAGEMVIEAKYAAARNFSEGLAAVNIGYDSLSVPNTPGQWGYINRDGEMVIPLRFERALFFTDGLARVQINGKWGVIDRQGKQVIEAKYGEIYPFGEGLAAARSAETGLWGFIDRAGNEVIPFRFGRVGTTSLFNFDTQYFNDGKILVREFQRDFYIDRDGNEIIDEAAEIEKLMTAFQQGNFDVAYQLAARATDRGNIDAMNLRAVMLAQGQGVTQDLSEALYWFEEAANAGHAAACGNVGLFYLQGLGVPQNETLGIEWLTKGANLGDEVSMFNLGYLAAQQGRFDDARPWLQQALEAGHPQAQQLLDHIRRLQR